MLDASSIYRSLQKDLTELDEDRLYYYRKVLPFKLSFWVPFLVIGIYLLVSINFLNQDISGGLIIGYFGWCFISLIAFLVMGHFQGQKFKEMFTKIIAPRIIGGLGESFSYQYNGQISKQEVLQTQLLDPQGKYECQDLVMGVVDEVPIKFAEIKMTKTTVVNQSEGKRKTEITFAGFFFSAALKATFPTDIWLSNTSKSEISNVGKSKIKIDHPALKNYRVYGDDEALTKKVLQPFVLDKIQALNKKLKSKRIAFQKNAVSFYFSDQMVKMAIFTHKKFMEPKLSKTVNSEAFIAKQTDLLNVLTAIVKDLTLK